MDAKLLFDLLRTAQGITSLINNWLATASPDAVKELVDEAHSQGITIDSRFLRGHVADMSLAVDSLDAKVRAAGG